MLGPQGAGAGGADRAAPEPGLLPSRPAAGKSPGSTRRSAADRRDAYYSLDLRRCADLFADAGAALHPALRLRRPSAPEAAARAAVLFLCTGNSARSPMAQALLGQLGAGRIDVESAGSHPKPVHEHAIRAMRVRGIDIAGHRPKAIAEVAGRRFHYVVTLCDRVREVCPELPGHPGLTHWSIADPAAAKSYPAFERTADELETRIRHLLHIIAGPRPLEEAS